MYRKESLPKDSQYECNISTRKHLMVCAMCLCMCVLCNGLGKRVRILVLMVDWTLCRVDIQGCACDPNMGWVMF